MFGTFLENFIAFILALLIMILITQYIWNNIMPQVFKLPEITLIQTLGLLILTNIFFGSHCNVSYILVK